MKSLMCLIILLAGLAVQASEAPAMFTKCNEKIKVKSPKNSSGYYFSETCNTIYVLPPLKGQVEISRPTSTTNTMMCSLINEVIESNKYDEAKLKNYRKKIEKLQKSRSSNGSMNPWTVSNDDNDGEIDPDDPVEVEIDRLNAKIRKTIKTLIEDSDTYSQVEGPKMTMAMVADVHSLTEQFRKMNPGLRFHPMPISKGVLSFINDSANTAKAKAALSWGVAGLNVNSGFFTGLKPEDLVDTKSSTNSHVLFSSAVTGQVVLSLVGACPFIDEIGEMPSVIDARDMAGHLATSVDYIYNVKVNRAYKASYNLAELFKRIQSQSKRGGFFSSKTIHSLVMEQKSEGWFKFESLSEDPRYEWDEQLAQTVKAQLIARAMKEIGAVPTGKSEAPGIIAPGKNGAKVVAEGLSKCPHVYCMAAGYILGGMDAIVGSSKAVSKFISTNNRWQSEVVSESKMVPQMAQVMMLEN